MSKYGELEKLKAIQDRSQVIGEFIDWLSSHKKIYLATISPTQEKNSEELLSTWPIPAIEQLLAEFFQINLQKVEEEKRQILKDIRKRNCIA